MSTGKIIRLRQMLDDRNRTFIIAIDQVIPRGLHPALRDPLETLRLLTMCDCDAILLHSGLLKLGAAILAGKKPFVIKLTTSTTEGKDRTNRVLVDTIEHALQLGAIGVALNVFIGSTFESSMLNNLRDCAISCDQLGMPLIVMINPVPESEFDAEKLAYVCRVGAELGADIVKTDYPGSAKEFQEVVGNCPVPVLIEESPLPETDLGTLQTVRDVMKAGGSGVMFGSRIWGQQDPITLSRQISQIIHS